MTTHVHLVSRRKTMAEELSQDSSGHQEVSEDLGGIANKK